MGRNESYTFFKSDTVSKCYCVCMCVLSLVHRDVVERGRTEAGVRAQYFATVKPAHDTYIQPSAQHANQIIPWHNGLDNQVAVEALVQHIHTEVYKANHEEE